MNRREALQILASGLAFQLAPGKMFATLREARALFATETVLRTLNPHQAATIKLMAELIIPKTETPGATDAGVTEFVDLMLTEWYSDQERTRFLTGLAEVDQHTQALFGKDFVDASPDQQADALNWLGEKMTSAATEIRNERPRRRGTPQNSPGFYPTMRFLTLTAYYTSEAGATEELHYEVIPAAHEACATIPPAEGGTQNQ